MNIFLALVFSLIAPGAGQAYNGQRNKAIWVAAGYLLSKVFFDVIVKFLFPHPELLTSAYKMSLAAAFVPRAGFYIGGFADALRQSLRIHKQGIRAETSNWKMALLVWVVMMLFQVGFGMWFRRFV